MALPKKLLVPTDFSEPSRAALDYAIDLAEPLGAAVHLVHAFELPIVGFPDGAMTITAEMGARISEAAQRALDDLVHSLRSRKVDLATTLVQSDPRDAVLSTAKKIGADLIVMGTHGRRGLTRALIGSVAESVVRTSPVPVLTIHGAETTPR